MANSSNDIVDFQDDSMNNTIFENYCAVEVVALPPNFDILSHLTMREQSGIFENPHISLKHLQVISMGVQSTAIFTLLNNPSVTLQSVAYFLQILDELGFIIKGINGDVSPGHYREYARIVEHYTGSQGILYFKGHQSKTINFTFINMIQILDNDVIEQSIKIAKGEYTEQMEATKKLESIGKLDGGET
jgi:hypothetical protein